MKKLHLLAAAGGLTAALLSTTAMAGPLEQVNQGLDDELFVYWSEIDPNAPASYPFGPIGDAWVSDDDDRDGVHDGTGGAPQNPYSRPFTTRSVDVIVFSDDKANLDDVVDPAWNVFKQVGEDLPGDVGGDDEVDGGGLSGTETIAFEGANLANYPANGFAQTGSYALDQTENGLAGDTIVLGFKILGDLDPGEPGEVPNLFDFDEDGDTDQDDLTAFLGGGDVPAFGDIDEDGDTDLDDLTALLGGGVDPGPGIDPADPFAVIDVFTSGNLLEPDTGCEVLTTSVTFDFGTDNSTGISAPANVEFLCGTGNPGDTEFRLSTTADDPATDGVDQDAASRYDVVMYNASLPGSQSDAGREKTMKLIDDATGLGVAETTYSVPASGTAESFSLHAELSDAQHGGKPIPRNSADPDNPEAFIMNVYL